MRVLIVGGVAGGASAAARLRRLDERCEIVMFERGPHVSFANCGLPYYVGSVIEQEKSLLVASRELFRDRFRIDVRTGHEALSIDRAAQTLRVREVSTRVEIDEAWDTLVLSPGASTERPGLAGMYLPGVFVVRSIADTRRLRAFLEERQRRECVVVGGGFIGLEMAENMIARGLQVTLLEKLPRVLPPLDPEMAALIQSHLTDHGVNLRLNEGLAGIVREGERMVVRTDRGATLETDMVILAMGVRPETQLAKSAGLAIGARGGIVVDERMRTSDPRIFAVGDAVEVHHVVSGQDTLLPLAGPANRQGRVAAEAIAGRPSRFGGVQGTAIVGALGLTVATTGVNEKGLRNAGRKDYHVVYLHPSHHAGYYPGAKPIHLKLIFAQDGKILGAQAIGTEGVDKRIDVIATVLHMGGTVHDLASAELCYAPQFGSAKDPVNVAGMMAENVLAGDMPLADWQCATHPEHLLLDVREAHEHDQGHLPGSINVPLSELRQRIDEVPRDRPVWLYCAAGQRAYVAQRLLLQNGYDAKNLSGGYATWLTLRESAAETPQRHGSKGAPARSFTGNGTPARPEELVSSIPPPGSHRRVAVG